MLWIISLINLTQGFPSMIIQPMTKYICAIFVTACPLYSMHRPIYNILHLLINSCFHLSAFRGIFIREKVLEKHNSSQRYSLQKKITFQYKSFTQTKRIFTASFAHISLMLFRVVGGFGQQELNETKLGQMGVCPSAQEELLAMIQAGS